MKRLVAMPLLMLSAALFTGLTANADVCTHDNMVVNDKVPVTYDKRDDLHNKWVNYICADCGNKTTDRVVEEAHNWSGPETEISQNDEEGHVIFKTYTCVCGIITSSEIEAHVYKGAPTLVDCYYSQNDEHDKDYIETCAVCGYEHEFTVSEAHSWKLISDETEYESVSDDEHELTLIYYCSECDEEEWETKQENHTWTYDESEDVYYETISQENHTKVIDYQCSACGETKTESIEQNHTMEVTKKGKIKPAKSTKSEHFYDVSYKCSVCKDTFEKEVNEKHTLDAYGICKSCKYVSALNTTLKAGKVVKTNGNSWNKIVVKKNGYITVSTPDKAKTQIALYDAKKNKMSSTSTSISKSKSRDIVVTAGTYYLKGSDPEAKFQLKYTFKELPAQKNISLKKATVLKPKSKITFAQYVTDKKNTLKRYFKITVKKDQKVTFFTNSLDAWLYDAKGKSVRSTHQVMGENKVKVWSDKKLKKGTYYIIVELDNIAKDAKKYRGELYYVQLP